MLNSNPEAFSGVSIMCHNSIIQSNLSSIDPLHLISTIPNILHLHRELLTIMISINLLQQLQQLSTQQLGNVNTIKIPISSLLTTFHTVNNIIILNPNSH